MNDNRRKLMLALGAALCGATGMARASWPDKPIRFIVPYPPGGIGDATSRAIAQRMAKVFNQPVVVENRPGGNQVIASQALAGSPADGYTMLLASIANMSINPTAFRKLPYDPQRDFAPVSLLFQAPLFLVVDARLPVRNVQDLIALARSRPGKLTYASIGTGSSVHLAGELFNAQARIETLHVPYKGSAPAITDMLGGQVDMMFDGGTSSLPHVKAGKLRVLAVTSSKRSLHQPDVPTMEEAGLPGYALTSWWGLVVPSGTPAAAINRLQAAWKQVSADAELQQAFSKDGIEFLYTEPEQFSAFVRGETERLGTLIKKSQIVLD
ncbi:MAG: Bug family tripartite tricarboxylate transporter substrate binding protein [Noviherbaspirillum sp.]